MYSEAVNSYMNMTGLECWNRCLLAFCLAKSGQLAQAKAVLKEFQSRTSNLGPSMLMDVIRPDVNPEFRRDLLDRLRSIEISLSDGESNEYGGS
jgi:hypothetical protein